MPAALPVEVTDSSGDMTLDGVRVTRVTDSSGDILARGLPGDVEIEDSSGDISVRSRRGPVRISDSSGDIVVRGARDVLIPRDSSGDIRIEQVSGSVRIDQDCGDATWQVSGVDSSVSGRRREDTLTPRSSHPAAADRSAPRPAAGNRRRTGSGG